MLSILDILAIAAYLLGCVLIGVWTTKKIKNSGTSEFYASSYALPGFAVFMTMFATVTGGGSTFGVAGFCYQIGLSGMLPLFVYALGAILFIIIFSKRLRLLADKFLKRDFYTMNDVLQHRYGRAGRIIGGFTGAWEGVASGASVVIALGTFVHLLLGVDFATGTILATLVCVVYCVMGGLSAVVWTDVFQGIIMLVVVVIPLPLMLIHDAGGWSHIVEATPPSFYEYTMPPWLFVTLVAWFFAAIARQHIFQRMIIAKDAKTSFWATGLALLIGGLWAIPVGIMGIAGYVLIPDAPPESIIQMCVLEYVPAGIKGIMIVGFMGVLMSSIDSVIHYTVANVNYDIIEKAFGSKPKTDREGVMRARICMILVSFFVLLFSLKVKGIIPALNIGFTVWSATIVVPWFAALLYKKATSGAAVAAMISGGLSGVIFLNTGAPLELPPSIAGVLVSLIVFLIVNPILYPKQAEKTLETWELLRVDNIPQENS